MLTKTSLPLTRRLPGRSALLAGQSQALSSLVLDPACARSGLPLPVEPSGRRKSHSPRFRWLAVRWWRLPEPGLKPARKPRPPDHWPRLARLRPPWWVPHHPQDLSAGEPQWWETSGPVLLQRGSCCVPQTCSPLRPGCLVLSRQVQ